MLMVLLVISSVAFYVVWQSQSTARREAVSQVGAFVPFAQGDYDGDVTFGELAMHGNFGLGTLDGIDGEMVALNGVFYQIPVDGVPRRISPVAETPFAVVTFFEADQILTVAEAMNYSQLQDYIDQNISPEAAVYAIRVHGVCDYLEVRSVPKQTEPYPSLTEVIDNQVVFTLSNVSGFMAGFRFPSYMDQVNVAGYHMHFISDDATSGGHLLDCIVRSAIIEIDYTYDYELVLD